MTSFRQGEFIGSKMYMHAQLLFFNFAAKEFSLCKCKGILQKVKTNIFDEEIRF